MTRLMTSLVTLVIAASFVPANAATKLDRKVDAATEVLEQLSSIPEKGHSV